MKIDETKDYSTKLIEFVRSLEGELATQALLTTVEVKKQEFVDWLKARFLYDLVTNPLVAKSEFEWECAKFINAIFEMFDSAIYKFYMTDYSMVSQEMIRRKNERICRDMIKLCKDFEERLGEFKDI